MISKNRCFGNVDKKVLLVQYRDEEWGVPIHDDTTHFEMLILEGTQASLNWETVLKKRENYHKAFKDFDPKKAAVLVDDDIETLRQEEDIIRNKLKIYASRKNAVAFLKIQQQFGSFNDQVWGFVGGKPILNTWKNLKDVPVTTTESDELSEDLKKRGVASSGSLIHCRQGYFGRSWNQVIPIGSNFPMPYPEAYLHPELAH